MNTERLVFEENFIKKMKRKKILDEIQIQSFTVYFHMALIAHATKTHLINYFHQKYAE